MVCRYQIQIIHFLRKKKLGNTHERRYIFQKLVTFPPQAYLPLAEAHLKTKRAKRTIKQRKTYAETLFAEAKNSHGLRRATCPAEGGGIK